MMSSELLATYSGLGTHDGERYFKGEECLACVKDLIRALRSDDSRCEIRRQLGLAGILQKDLLPILFSSDDDALLRNDVIRLLVNLTQPAYLCFGSAYPKHKDTDAMKCFMEVNRYLRAYKEAFTDESVMNVLGSVLAELCQKDWDNRDDDDIIVIERILLLIRNLLHITPEPQEEKRTEDDVSVHDQIVWNLHVNGIDELLLFLGSNPDETQWCMHVLEIVFLMLREQLPSALARTGKGRTAEEKKRDEDAVDEALARERARRVKAQSLRGTRHSRFGGTFVVKDQKSISGGNRVYHHALAGLQDRSYDVEKRPRRTNCRRRPASDLPKERLSTYSIRVVLRSLCAQFLECCYNPLMRVVKDNITRRRAMDNDETYFLWAIRFFMEFSRAYDFRVDIVGETLQLPTLHYLIQLLASYYESMVLEKKEINEAKLWGQRLHYAVEAYRELLFYIHEMSQSKSEALRDSAKVMQSNIFYHPEYRDIFITLLRNFNEVTQTRSCLCALIEAAHTYIRMMEHHCRDNRHMIVQERKKKGGRGKGRGRSRGQSAILTEDQLIDLWEKMDARVGELLDGSTGEALPATAVPFDAASEQAMEEQKITAMGRIRQHLIDACHGEAVSLMRAAREVWPDDEFGSEGMAVDEEMETVRAILLNPAAALPAARLLEDAGYGDNEDDEEEGGGGGGGGTVQTVELEFDIKKYIQRFSNNKIVRAYCLVLATYKTNSDTINHVVVRMLHRIAIDLKMSPLLYQISVFRTMQAVLHEPRVERLKELQKFCRHVISGFFHMAAGNHMMFVELLFWRTSSECYELSEGYGILERQKLQKKMASVWSREQEEELAELFQRFQDEEDVVACIEAALPPDLGRARKHIVSQLLSQGLVVSRTQLKKKAPKRNKAAWSEEELEMLRSVFQPQDDMKAAVKSVAEYFPDRLLKDITQQLKALGLLPDKKRKKNVESGSDSDDSATPRQRQKRPASTSRGGGDRRSPQLPSKRARETEREDNRKRMRKNPLSVSGVARRLHTSGYSDQLAWLEAYLTDEARDRTLDDEWEEMCVVAIGEQEVQALRSRGFRDLLLAIGLQSPNEQELYWRIPASMTPQQLNAAARALRPSPVGAEAGEIARADSEMAGTSQSPVSSGDEQEASEDDLSDSDDNEEEMLSRGDALSVLISKRKSRKGEDEETTESKVAKPKAKKPRLMRTNFLDSDSNSDSEEEIEEAKESHSSEDTSHSPPTDQNSINVVREKRKRARQLMDSDSESDGNVDRSEAGRGMMQSQPATAGSLHHQLELPELTENTVDSESDGNDHADKTNTEGALIQSQLATAGGLHHQLQSPELTENTVVNAHEQIAVATEGSMPELAFSQTASNHTDM